MPANYNPFTIDGRYNLNNYIYENKKNITTATVVLIIFTIIIIIFLYINDSSDNPTASTAPSLQRLTTELNI